MLTQVAYNSDLAHDIDVTFTHSAWRRASSKGAVMVGSTAPVVCRTSYRRFSGRWRAREMTASAAVRVFRISGAGGRGGGIGKSPPSPTSALHIAMPRCGADLREES